MYAPNPKFRIVKTIPSDPGTIDAAIQVVHEFHGLWPLEAVEIHRIPSENWVFALDLNVRASFFVLAVTLSSASKIERKTKNQS